LQEQQKTEGFDGSAKKGGDKHDHTLRGKNLEKGRQELES